MTPRSSCPGGESTPLQGANLRLNYEINNVTDTALGNLARGKPSFCRSDRCLSYRPPGSLFGALSRNSWKFTPIEGVAGNSVIQQDRPPSKTVTLRPRRPPPRAAARAHQPEEGG